MVDDYENDTSEQAVGPVLATIPSLSDTVVDTNVALALEDSFSTSLQVDTHLDVEMTSSVPAAGLAGPDSRELDAEDNVAEMEQGAEDDVAEEDAEDVEDQAADADASGSEAEAEGPRKANSKPSTTALLPVSQLTKHVKAHLPAGAMVLKDARAAFSRAATAFVLCSTAFAADHAKSCGRQIIMDQDVIAAMKAMGMEGMLDVPAVPEAAAKPKPKATKATKATASGKKRGRPPRSAASPADQEEMQEEMEPVPVSEPMEP